MNGIKTMHTKILDFWFNQSGYEQWFSKNENFDAIITNRFMATYTVAKNGELDHWMDTAKGTLALIIVLDQFPRNMFRGLAKSFETDSQARKLTWHALSNGFDLDLDITQAMRGFFYLPLEHSENLNDQTACVKLAKERMADDDNFIDYATQHLKIIERFGRFPHRNKALARIDTDDEKNYLSSPDSGF